jgi:hypothetical protein
MNKSLHFFVVVNIVQDNGDNSIEWYECQEVIEVIIEAASSCIRNTTRLL